MEAISHITRWSSWLIIVVPVAAGFTVTYYAVSKALSFDMEHKGHCNVRIKQTIIGAIIAMSIGGLINLIKLFYT